MAKLPKSPCMWGYTSKYGNATQRVREALGIKGTKIPRDMHGEFRVDGWNVVVKRGPAQRSRGKDWRGKERFYNSSKHRIFVRVDGRLIPVGRVHQALCRPKKSSTWHRMRYGENSLSGTKRRK